MGDFWVVVTRIATEPVAYVMTRDEVLERTHKAEKDGKISYWMEPDRYELDEFRNSWRKITSPA